MMFLSILTFILALAAASASAVPTEENKSHNIIASAAGVAERVNRVRRNPAIEEFPFHARLLLKNSRNQLRWCSGSIIDNEWVLTAAHCTEDTKEAVVHLGVTSQRPPQLMHKVTNKNFIIHSDWDRDILKNDISVIKIPYTDFNEQVQAVKLPAAGGGFYGTYDGDEVIIPGWCNNSNSSDTATTNNLSYSYMSVVPNSQCRRYYGGVVRSSNICIAAYGGTSNCIGDSGSPLVLKTSRTQIGLTSLASRHAPKNSIPAVFTRISYYLDWIKDNTGISI